MSNLKSVLFTLWARIVIHPGCRYCLRSLESAEAAVCYEAAGACGELGTQETVPYLINLVNDSDIDIQIAAIQALCKIGGTQAEEFLELCLDNTNEALRQAAEQALNETGRGEDRVSFPL